MILYFFVNCVGLLIGYYILNLFLVNTNSKYKQLTRNRKMYVLKNILKSMSLGYLTIFKFHFYSDMINNNWDNNSIYKFASLYIVNDFLGLLLNKKLPVNTKHHHITSILLYIFLINIDFTQNSPLRLIFTYGTVSSMPFLVNYYLGIRHISDKNKVNIVKKLAYYVYGFSCSLNLVLHVYLIIQNKYYLNPICYLYLVVLIPIINDDIILISWLKE